MCGRESSLTPDRRANEAEPRVGLVSEGDIVTPVLYAQGQPVRNIHNLIRSWEELGAQLSHGPRGDSTLKLSDVKLLAPLRGRDILCVGKNYKEHAA